MMKSALKKIVYITLLVFYGFSATVGNIVALKELLNSGNKNHQQLTSEKKSRPIPDSSVSIVRSHTAPVIVTDHSLHIAPVIYFTLMTEPTTIVVHAEIDLIYSSLEFLPSKPRDPPLA